MTSGPTPPPASGGELFRALVENSSDGIALIDREGRVVFASAPIERVLGLRPDEIVGGDGFARIHEDDLERTRIGLAELMQHPGRTEVTEFRARHRDGSWREIEGTATNRFGEPGIDALVVNFRDITQRNRTERELRLLQDSMRSVSDLVRITDLDDRLLFVNAAFLDAYGYRPDEILGRPVDVFWSPRMPRSRIDEIFRESRRSGWKGEIVTVARDGREIPVELVASPIRDEKGSVVGLIGIGRDITERKEAERLQSALYRIAETASSVDDLRQFYTAIHLIVGELMEASNFYVALRDDATGRLTFPYFADEADTAPPAAASGGLTDYVIATGEPLLASPEGFEALVRRGAVTALGAPSLDWLGAPLRTEGEVFGALVVQSYTADRRFGEKDRDILMFVSRHIASAIARRRAAEALRNADQFRERVLESATNAIFALDRRGRFTLVNRRACEITGYATEELIGFPAERLIPFSRLAEVRAQFRKAARDRVPVALFETDLVRRDGSLAPITFSIAPLLAGRRVIGLAGTAEDITERRRAQERIEHLAYHDALTGLPNHALLQDRLEIAISRARHDGRSIAVLFLDLDRFKVVNDSLGHPMGDRLLQRVAERLTGVVRQGDTVARLGGDEFVVVLSDLKQVEDAARIGEKIISGIRLPFRVGDEELFVTTSLGISVFPSDGDSGETLIKNADTAMYRAKEQGRDNYQLFTPVLNARSVNRLALETGLRRAVENGELRLHYQPIVDLATGETTAIEALVRWQHPERGLVLPSDFVPLAEETGLIVPLGAWVLATAAAQIRDWRDAGRRPPRVAINFSTRQLAIPTLAADIGRALRDAGIEPSDLEMEITESVAMNNPEESLGVLYAIRHLGVRISMDDFGTGYSSLGMLKRLPIDTLKLDRAFLRDIETSVDDAAISRAVIVLAHGMKLTVTAEGVETESQMTFLRRHRCDHAQGFFLCRPVPAPELEEVLGRGAFGPERPAAEAGNDPGS